MTKITGFEKAEAWRLQEAVKQIEAMIGPGAAPGGSVNSMLTRFIEQAKNRIADLQDLEVKAIEEEREKSLKEVGHAMMAQREAALSAAEQRQYEEFLSREHFTKADFGSLEQFYTNTWDRLSEEGKSEMSHRIWEGVRQNEYEFSELPDIVRQKEAERLRDMMHAQCLPLNLERIPQNDRDDFVSKWDGGDRAGAYEVLDRPSFAENVALSARPVQAETVAVADRQEAARVTETEMKTPTPVAVSAQPAGEAKQPEEGAAKKQSGETGNAIGLKELNLDGVQLVADGAAKPTPPLAGEVKSGVDKGK